MEIDSRADRARSQVAMLRDRFFLVLDVDRVLRPKDLEATAALREEPPPPNAEGNPP